MKPRCIHALCLFAAAGSALGLSAMALGQSPAVINISGATLQQNYLTARGSTNDFIDANNDGQSIQINGTPQDLAPQPAATGYAAGYPGAWWIVQYRAVGSVNGLLELVRFGSVPGTGTLSVTSNGSDLNGIRFILSSNSQSNRRRFMTNGVMTGSPTPNAFFNRNNPGANPVRSRFSTANDYVATGFNANTTDDGSASPSGTPAATPGGVRIDIAPLDVPAFWGVRVETGTAAANRKPAQNGYGNNTRVLTNLTGSPSIINNAPLTPRLISLTSTDAAGNPVSRNFNTGAANGNTIFDTLLAYAPVAVMVNPGVGRYDFTYSELSWSAVTGRLRNGENLNQVTRDSGSGTRNSYDNSLGHDPSFGVGEGIAGPLGESILDVEHRLGPQWIPGNKGSSNGMELTTIYHRLSIGYSGAERARTGGSPASWRLNNQAQVGGVINDHIGGTQPTRPLVTSVVNNGPANSGYRIGNVAVFSTIGDPLAEPVANGGNNNGNPRMANTEAAKYLNNYSRSLTAFVTQSTAATASPAELAASQFLLIQAMDNLPSSVDPALYQTNAGLITNVQNDAIANSVLRFATTYGPADPTLNGIVPARTPGPTYSDGVAGGTSYRDQAGTLVAYSELIVAPTASRPLNARNRIAGDFNNDGLRTAADVPEMLLAWCDRNGGPTWQAGTPAVVEILGDFNGDGNFDRADIRYWADGLHLLSGRLNRAAGFTAVDNAYATLPSGCNPTSSNNFFGTVLATGKAYAAGDSRGDVVGSNGLTTPGFRPTADGRVDANDIDYVTKQFLRSPCVTGLQARWGTNLNEASCTDLSADMNGDLIIDRLDVDVLVRTILGTNYGDVNLDGRINQIDLITVRRNLGTTGGWAAGDMTGEGTVDGADEAIVLANGCFADYNLDGIVNTDDISDYITDYFTVPEVAGSTDPLLNGYGIACPGALAPYNTLGYKADFNNDCLVNTDDISDFITTYFAGCV